MTLHFCSQTSLRPTVDGQSNLHCVLSTIHLDVVQDIHNITMTANSAIPIILLIVRRILISSVNNF